MKKKDLKYVIFLAVMFVIYILVELFSPSGINWTETYDENHKIPYGTYAMNSLLTDIFGQGEIEYSNSTLYDLGQKETEFDNLIIISRHLFLGYEDGNALWKMMDEGKHVLIAASWFRGNIFDSLNVGVSHSITRRYMTQDTSQVFMHDDSPFAERGPFKYHPSHASNYFYSYDSTMAELWASESHKDPVLVRYKLGSGTLILCTMPLAFTNYYVLKGDNNYFVSNALSLLPVGNIHFTNYYQYGRLEPVSKLRFLLVNPSLKWAYYISIGAILTYMVFGSKRRQRAIPVIAPPRNSTLDFIGTMGNLYFNKRNNKNMAIKKISYFLDFLRQKYYLKTDVLDDDFAGRLALKTNKELNEVKKLISLIKWVEQKKTVSDRELMELNRIIEDYYFN